MDGLMNMTVYILLYLIVNAKLPFLAMSTYLNM